MSDFGDRLNELILESRMTLEQLADAIGVTLPTVYEWKAGKHLFYSNLIKLCDCLNCSIDFISGRSDTILDFNPQTPPPFPQAVRAMMKQRNITSYRLRKETRYDGSYFARWDRGAEPYLNTLVELADYFECTIDQLVGREKLK